jgi:uncharacterized membrane protein
MKTTFLFGKKNFILLIVGLVLIAFGFILMSGGGSDDPNVFNPEIFNSTRIIIAPIFVLAGFIVEIFAIMSKPEESAE